MRPLELVLLVADLVACAALAVRLPDTARWPRHAAALAIPSAALQWAVEGPRWQLAPGYALAAVVFAAWLAGARRAPERPRARPWARRCRRTLGVVALAIAFALPVAIPVFRMPAPTGGYPLGTSTYHWVDHDRRERFAAAPAARRELVVQLWYPAAPTPSAPRAPYVQDAAALEPLAHLLDLPGFALGHLRYVTTNSVEGAPAARGEPGFPVVIFSHGRGGFRQHNTVQVEALVSHGYIVAAIDHPYVASGVVFPDGRLAAFDPRMLDRAFVDSVIPYLAEDVSFTLGQLAALNRSDPHGILTGRLDLARVGIFGLSLGGEVTVESCRTDPRLRACLAMDVWMPIDVVRSGLAQPTMLITRDAATMRLEGWSPAAIDETLATLRAVYAGARGGGYLVEVPGMFHQDFSDAPLLSPLTSMLGITGPIDRRRARDIVAAYVLAFFDRHLRARPAALLDAPSPRFPEVRFESRPALREH